MSIQSVLKIFPTEKEFNLDSETGNFVSSTGGVEGIEILGVVMDLGSQEVTQLFGTRDIKAKRLIVVGEIPYFNSCEVDGERYTVTFEQEIRDKSIFLLSESS